jgi:hypothetical protein
MDILTELEKFELTILAHLVPIASNTEPAILAALLIA